MEGPIFVATLEQSPDQAKLISSGRGTKVQEWLVQCF